jgi:hypothetical protein
MSRPSSEGASTATFTARVVPWRLRQVPELIAVTHRLERMGKLPAHSRIASVEKASDIGSRTRFQYFFKEHGDLEQARIAASPHQKLKPDR